MLQELNTIKLDKLFEALANQHRREIVYRLSLQPDTISQLANSQNLSLPAIHKHIKILENNGLLLRKKIGRTNILALNRSALQELHTWLAQYQSYWGTNNESLINYESFIQKKKKGGETK